MTTAAAAPSTQDALEVLREDHRRIESMLADCERLAAGPGASSAADRSGLVSRLGALVIAHGQMEQQLFYPALKAQGSEVDRAIDEHEQLERLLGGLAAAEGSASDFASRVQTLATALRGHLRSEEAQLFGRTQGLDLQALGIALAIRRGELLGDQGID